MFFKKNDEVLETEVLERDDRKDLGHFWLLDSGKLDHRLLLKT
jgi:hypothetical protein